MRTKQAEMVRYYILTHIDMSEQSMYLNNIGTHKGLLTELMDRFDRYARERISLGYTRYECFATFAGGLPSYFRIDYVTSKQKELLKKWGLRGNEDFYRVIYSELKEWEEEGWEY